MQNSEENDVGFGSVKSPWEKTKFSGIVILARVRGGKGVGSRRSKRNPIQNPSEDATFSISESIGIFFEACYACFFLSTRD